MRIKTHQKKSTFVTLISEENETRNKNPANFFTSFSGRFGKSFYAHLSPRRHTQHEHPTLIQSVIAKCINSASAAALDDVDLQVDTSAAPNISELSRALIYRKTWEQDTAGHLQDNPQHTLLW